MRAPTDFSHGAALLAKDVNLLGDALGANQHWQAMQRVASPFLKKALAE